MITTKKILTICLSIFLLGNTTQPLLASSTSDTVTKEASKEEKSKKKKKGKKIKQQTKTQAEDQDTISNPWKIALGLGLMAILYIIYRTNQSDTNLSEVSIASDNTTVYLWDPTNKTQRKIETGADAGKNIIDVALSAHGKLIAILYDDKLVLYDATTFDKKYEKNDVTKFQFSPNGAQIALALKTKVEIRSVWDQKKNAFVDTLHKQLSQQVQGNVTDLQWSHQGDYLSYAGQEKSITLCNAATGTCKELMKKYKQADFKHILEISWSWDDKYLCLRREVDKQEIQICSFDKGDGNDFKLKKKYNLDNSKFATSCQHFRFAHQPQSDSPDEKYPIASLQENKTITLLSWEPVKKSLTSTGKKSETLLADRSSFAWSKKNLDIAISNDTTVIIYENPVENNFGAKFKSFKYPDKTKVEKVGFGAAKGTKKWDKAA